MYSRSNLRHSVGAVGEDTGLALPDRSSTQTQTRATAVPLTWQEHLAKLMQPSEEAARETTSETGGGPPYNTKEDPSLPPGSGLAPIVTQPAIEPDYEPAGPTPAPAPVPAQGPTPTPMPGYAGQAIDPCAPFYVGKLSCDRVTISPVETGPGAGIPLPPEKKDLSKKTLIIGGLALAGLIYWMVKK